jgi:hypothetical protein
LNSNRQPDLKQEKTEQAAAKYFDRLYDLYKLPLADGF